MQRKKILSSLQRTGFENRQMVQMFLKLKQVWNQRDKWNNLGACRLVICDQGGYKNHTTGLLDKILHYISMESFWVPSFSGC